MARAPRTAAFAARVIAWQRTHGRHGLPWQGTRDAYRIWLSEVMLQQTQVATVLPYYARFVARFPGVRALAAAPVDDVLAHWSGLGYYRRAHHLHAAAKVVCEQHGGVFPTDAATLATLPGIGRSTAAAIAAFASGERAAILDGNVKRVLARHRGIDGFPGLPAVERRLWQAAEALLPAADVAAYTQGVMDLGATLCVRSEPRCLLCPVADDCVARVEGRVAELPAPRPARSTPQREVQVLLCVRGGRVLVERRPAIGVWGGLWSLPEVAMGIDPVATAVARTGGVVVAHEALSPLRHAFTHFTLTLHPRRVTLADAGVVASAENERWVTRAEALALGLPAPVRLLLTAEGQSPIPAMTLIGWGEGAAPSRPTGGGRRAGARRHPRKLPGSG